MDRQERYRDSDGQIRERTVTDWYPENGNYNGSARLYCDACSTPQRLLTPSLRNDRLCREVRKMTALAAQVAEGEPCIDYSPLLADARRILPATSNQAAWDSSGNTQLRNRIEREIKSMYAGKIRNIRFTTKLDVKGEYRLLSPVRVTEYTYHGKAGALLFSEINPAAIAGTTPVSAGKVVGKILKWLLPAGLLFCGFYLGFKACMAAIDETLSMWFLLGGPLLMLAGIIFAVVTFKQFKKHRF